ncbi:MAG: TM2 domain-containing protein [Candidatus Calescibacterium sp.]|nr:TM2 domain-containing protein [Candidatus Calescibacterium sp.]MCX7733960.1 TM2 domain-containing protein [bacterium]MDW8086441.1 TM2 domain-containing protein [Candidatus Calescibacterium sp.]
MTDDKIKLVSTEFSRRKKDVLTAYVLCIFFWFAGVHKFYLLRPTEGILYISLVSAGILSFLSGFFFFHFIDILKASFIIFLITFVFLLYDVITLWKQVERTNDKIYAEIFEKITGQPYQ